uniref:WGS project CBMG000000000 data, contig CS5907-c001388 n=1 Tax=Fusarium acuminatum CS5907 TaxID=1318461 RepID=A0A096PF33_9HYPO|nr:unnamed protein product [Fusarium acuminatum CS5907]
MFMGPPIKDSPIIDGPVSVLPRVSRNSIQVEIDPRKQLRGPHIYYTLIDIEIDRCLQQAN